MNDVLRKLFGWLFESTAKTAMITLMLFASFVLGALFGIVMTTNEVSDSWHVMAHHSDNPADVLRAIDGVERRIDFEVAELRTAHFRGMKKQAEWDQGIAEPGEVWDEATKAEKKSRAGEWRQVETRAGSTLKKYGAQ